MATAPTVFERTHNQNKEPTRYFTPTAVGVHFKRPPASILNDFQSGKVQALELGDYTYKPTASRPGPMSQMGESGLDKMEPLREARKSATLDLTPEQRKSGELAQHRAATGPSGKVERKNVPGLTTAQQVAAKDIKQPIKKAADIPEAHRKKIASQDAMMPEAMKNVMSPKSSEESLFPPTEDLEWKNGRWVKREKPIQKAADDFSHEEWTGMKPLDKPAPDREKFLQTGEVSPEAAKKQSWWDRMKERLRFKRSDTDEDKKSDEEEAQRIADEQKQEHLGRLIRREKLPGYDAWKLASPDDKPVKKSANGEEDMEQTGGTHIDAGHVDVSIKKSRRADGSVDHLTH